MQNLLEMQTGIKHEKNTMQRYKTDVVQFDRLTRKVSAIQRAIVREFRDIYLQKEGPLDQVDLAEFGGENHPDVRAVLNTFFDRTEAGFACSHFDSELEAMKTTKEARQRAAKTRWKNACAKQTDACAMQNHAHAMHMHEIESGSGKEGDSQKLGGDYRGGKEDIKKKRERLSGSLFPENPSPSVPLSALTEEPKWLETLAGWFGRPHGNFLVEELLDAHDVETRHRPSPNDIETLRRYYQATHPAGRDFRRRSLGALLTHWTTELDRARMHARSAAKSEVRL
jgi:uncharacterized protein YdaU (DUF1376 family)